MPKSIQRHQDQRHLLDRILDTPNLALAVPRLQPEVLHRVIQIVGLEDCGELVALATPGQLTRVFDLDLWRSSRPGLDEQFDADRFGLWLELLMDCGADVAAHKLADMDADLVIAGLAQHIRVIDVAAGVRPAADEGPSRDVGGYRVVAKRYDSWDAIGAVLVALATERQDAFHRVMRGCRRLSNSKPEIDGLHDLLTDGEQAMFDLAFDRERRREKQGYVTPAQARVFLQMSRHVRGGDAPTATAPANPVARAYFRAIEWAPPAQPDHKDAAAAIAAVVDILADEGVLPQPPRALLAGPEGPAPRLARIQAQMQFVRDNDHDAFLKRTEEFAYLANAILAGCSIQARPFTAREASDAAAAACNLGLENWPRTTPPADFLVGHDLISVFQVGWTVLHDDVCMYSAERLINVLSDLRWDDGENQAGVDILRAEMAKQRQDEAPWRARDALDVIMILDMPAWATLLGLIDECPVIHAGIDASRDSRTRAVSASAFEFISENSQIASVREFMQSLPDTLRH